MNPTEKEDDFRLRDSIALRVMEHLITRKNHELSLDASDERVEKIARVAYKLANAMCKARLAAFT